MPGEPLYDFSLESGGIRRGFKLAESDGIKSWQVGLAPVLAPQQRLNANDLYEGQPPEVAIVAAFEQFTGGAGFLTNMGANPEELDAHNLTRYNYSRGVDLSQESYAILSPMRNETATSTGDDIDGTPVQVLPTSLGTFLITENRIYEWDVLQLYWISRDTTGGFTHGAIEFNGYIYVPRGATGPYLYSNDGITWTASSRTTVSGLADGFCTKGDDGTNVNVIIKLYANTISAATDGINSGSAWSTPDTIGPTNEVAKWVIPATNTLLIFKNAGIYSYDFTDVDDLWKTDYLKVDNANTVYQWRNGKFYANYGDQLLEYDFDNNTYSYVYPTSSMDSSEIKGAITGITGDNSFLYITVQNLDGNTYVIKGRPGESWHTLAFPVGDLRTDDTLSGTAASDATIGTVAWTDPSNITLNNGSYATATAGTSRYLLGTNYGFSVPTDATIVGVKLTEVRRVAATSQSFAYTGSAQTFTVPAGVTTITVDAYGATGGTGGYGARVRTTLAVTPAESLQVNVGGQNSGATGGWNGGGSGSGNGLGGGGSSDIRQGGTALADRVLVAAGGGGFGGSGSDAGDTIVGGTPGIGGLTGTPGGAGASATGAPGGSGGTGGTASAGGSGGAGGVGVTATGSNGTAGALGLGGAGGAAGFAGAGGAGGGGGYYGGGGGGGGGYYALPASYGGSGGGGGGSSYPASATVTSGASIGNGSVTISWTPSDTTDNNVTLFASGVPIGANKATAIVWSTTADETVEYGGSNDLWSASLTPAIVNDTTFGAAVSATVGNGATAEIQSLRLTVYYSVAGSSMTSQTMLLAAPGYIHATNPALVTGFGDGAVYYIFPRSTMSPLDDPNYRFETNFGEDGAFVVGPYVDNGAAAYTKFLNRGTVLGSSMSAGKPVTLSYEYDATTAELLVAVNNGLNARNLTDTEVEYNTIRYIVTLATTSATTTPVAEGWTFQSTLNAPRYRVWSLIADLSNSALTRDMYPDYWQEVQMLERFLYSLTRLRVTLTDIWGAEYIVRVSDLQSVGFTRHKIGNEERNNLVYQITLLEIAPVSNQPVTFTWGTNAYGDGGEWS